MKVHKNDASVAIAFGVLIAILMGVSWLGLAEMARMNTSLDELASRRWAKVQLARRALWYSNLNNRITLEVFLLKDPSEIRSLLKLRAENSGKITALLDQIRPLSESDRETSLIQNVADSRSPYVESYQKALKLLLDDKNVEGARTAMTSEAMPNLIAYHNTWNAFVDFQGDRMDQAARESHNNYLASRMVMISLILLAASIAVIVASFVIGREHRRKAAQHLANQERDRLLRELEQRTQQTGLLASLSDLLQGCVSLDEAYANIAKFAQALFPQSTGMLLLLSPSRNLLEVASSWKITSRETVFNSSSCWAVRTGHAHFFTVDTPAPTCLHVAQSDCSYVCLPLMAQAEELGVLHMGLMPRQQFTNADVQLANSLAKQASLSLANLKLQETLRAQSVKDPLTGLYNRRYMEESLERETRRAMRARTTIGVIMLDLDHFKSFNDLSGHEAGDAVLREMGDLLRTQVRDGDTVCRFGGEEFMIIMPGASLSIAEMRADGLRHHVKTLKVQHLGQMLGTITISCGVAIFPDHGSTGADVLRSADSALYRAKQNGRDQVVLALGLSSLPNPNIAENLVSDALEGSDS